jgi:hypothetical protein
MGIVPACGNGHVRTPRLFPEVSVQGKKWEDSKRKLWGVVDTILAVAAGMTLGSFRKTKEILTINFGVL